MEIDANCSCIQMIFACFESDYKKLNYSKKFWNWIQIRRLRGSYYIKYIYWNGSEFIWRIEFPLTLFCSHRKSILIYVFFKYEKQNRLFFSTFNDIWKQMQHSELTLKKQKWHTYVASQTLQLVIFAFVLRCFRKTLL